MKLIGRTRTRDGNVRLVALLLCLGLLGEGSSLAASETPSCFGRAATIVGSPRDDQLRGTRRSDVIVGLGGGDTIYGRGGNDLICAGKGGIYGPRGPIEFVSGGRGNDRISGGGGEDRLNGGPGNDILIGGIGSDQLFGTAGRDRLRSNRGGDILIGGRSNDTLSGGLGVDLFFGNEGDDVMNGGRGGPAGPEHPLGGPNDNGGDWVIYGLDVKTRLNVDLATSEASGDGKDELVGIENIFGGEGPNHLAGNGSGNVLIGAGEDDILIGRGGSDCFFTGGGSNDVEGGAGLDHYTGDVLSRCRVEPGQGSSASEGIEVNLAEGTATSNSGSSTLHAVEGAYGTFERDTLTGDSSGNDLYGGGSADRIDGGAGDDYLDGGPGQDFVDGGPDKDQCVNSEIVMNCEG